MNGKPMMNRKKNPMTILMLNIKMQMMQVETMMMKQKVKILNPPPPVLPDKPSNNNTNLKLVPKMFKREQIKKSELDTSIVEEAISESKKSAATNQEIGPHTNWPFLTFWLKCPTTSKQA